MSRLTYLFLHHISDSVSRLPLVVLRIGFVYGPYVEFGLCEFISPYVPNNYEIDLLSRRISDHRCIHLRVHE